MKNGTFFFKFTKLHCAKRGGWDNVEIMQIDCDRGRCVKHTESTGAYNFIYKNLPTSKFDQCEFYFNVFQELDTHHTFVRRKGGVPGHTINIRLLIGSS